MTLGKQLIYLFLISLIFTFSGKVNAQVIMPKVQAVSTLTPSSFQNNTPSNSQKGIEQYQKDVLKQQQQQKILQEVYDEILTPKKQRINYELPSCSNMMGTNSYKEAYKKLLSFELSDDKVFNTKEAIFLVENAFFENKGDYKKYNYSIQEIKKFLLAKMEEENYSTTSNVAKNLIIYRFFTDTLTLDHQQHLPFQYDFEDYMGVKDWTKMFVEKALVTNSGQCHSLPLLYLILANEIGAKAQLAYSPNHTYVKFKDDNDNWHNMELTNGMMTTDAFILQSGYVKAEALQSGIYMQPLNNKELLSQCLLDLANGYASKYCYDDFVKMVVGKALELNPKNIHAHLLKADYLTLKYRYVENQLGINKDNYQEKFVQYPKAKEVILTRNRQYKMIDNLGFESMPPDAYEKWLGSLNNEMQKQQSKRMIINLNKEVN